MGKFLIFDLYHEQDHLWHIRPCSSKHINSYLYLSTRMYTDTILLSKLIADYHTACWKHLRKYLRRVAKKGGEAATHQARVEIKKLVALYDHIAFSVAGYNNRRELEPLMKIFKKLGKIRDHSNALKFCEAFKINDDVFSKQKKSLPLLRKKLHNLIDKNKGELKKIEKAHARYLALVTEQQWRAYLHIRYERICRAQLDKPNAETLHQLRRDIKQLLYNAGIAVSAAAMISTAENQRLRHIESLIGDWHDIELFYDKLLQMGYCGRFPATGASIRQREQQLRRQIAAAINKKAQP
jgi:CHAD domain-containing protein